MAQNFRKSLHIFQYISSKFLGSEKRKDKSKKVAKRVIFRLYIYIFHSSISSSFSIVREAFENKRSNVTLSVPDLSVPDFDCFAKKHTLPGQA